MKETDSLRYLFPDTVSVTYFLYPDTVSVTYFLYPDTVSVTYFLYPDTVSVNNLFLYLIILKFDIETRKLIYHLVN